MKSFEVIKGSGPIILGQPHGGTWLPDALLARLNENGRKLADTDWHIGRLYDGLLHDVTIVRSNVHRYAIDANRDPMGISLYPGQNTTELCPTTDFDGLPIWHAGQEASLDEIEARRWQWHEPYHAALASEILRVKAKHGLAVLYDCHSIRSNIPFLFEGLLPVFSIGTNHGQTCAPAIEKVTHAICKASNESVTLNGRFKGGWTTRYYGNPREGIHAIQMELGQRSYLEQEAEPWAYDACRAGSIRATLSDILHDTRQLALDSVLNTTLA